MISPTSGFRTIGAYSKDVTVWPFDAYLSRIFRFVADSLNTPRVAGAPLGPHPNDVSTYASGSCQHGWFAMLGVFGFLPRVAVGAVRKAFTPDDCLSACGAWRFLHKVTVNAAGEGAF